MTCGDVAETFDPGEVYTIASPEPAFEPDDWPSNEEQAEWT